MSQPVVVVGGGGMGRCVLDVIDAVNCGSAVGPLFEVLGIVDDGSPDLDLLGARDVKHLGGLDVLDAMSVEVGYLIGIGAPTVRSAIDSALVQSGRPSPVLVHPNVHRGFDVRLAPGVFIGSHVSMENNIRVGRHVHINQNSTVGHDTIIGDYATISPLSAVSGGVRVEDAVFVGTGATINQGITLGRGSTIGANAAVITEVGVESTVVGVPARLKHSNP
jgi:sugar O-acyltransferase (sialic acid O-acetyltransferase NeuD family)